MTAKMIDWKKVIDASFILISFFHRKSNDKKMCNKLANYPQMEVLQMMSSWILQISAVQKSSTSSQLKCQHKVQHFTSISTAKISLCNGGM